MGVGEGKDDIRRRFNRPTEPCTESTQHINRWETAAGEEKPKAVSQVVLVAATEGAVSSAAVVFATRILAGSAALVVMCVVATSVTGGVVLSDGSVVWGGTGGKQCHKSARIAVVCGGSVGGG